MDDARTPQVLLANGYHEFLDDLDVLYIAGNLSGRVRFSQKWPLVAERMFGSMLMSHDKTGIGDKAIIRRLEQQGEMRRVALYDIVRDLEKRSLDHGTLRLEFVREVLDKVGPELAVVLYSSEVIEKVMVATQPTPAEKLRPAWDARKAPVQPPPSPSAPKKRVRAFNIVSNPYAVPMNSPILTEPYPYSDVVEKIKEVSQKFSYLPEIMQGAVKVIAAAPAKASAEERVQKVRDVAQSLPSRAVVVEILMKIMMAVKAEFEPFFRAKPKANKVSVRPKVRPQPRPQVKPKMKPAVKEEQPVRPEIGVPSAEVPVFKVKEVVQPSPPPLPVTEVLPPVEAVSAVPDIPLLPIYPRSVVPLVHGLVELEGYALAYVMPFLDKSFNPLLMSYHDWGYLTYFLRTHDGNPLEVALVAAMEGVNVSLIQDLPWCEDYIVVIEGEDVGYYSESFVADEVTHPEMIPDIGYYLDEGDLYE